MLVLWPILAFLSISKFPEVSGHGRLIEPPSRASAWRYGFSTPHNYNDHELYCGGFTRQWVKNEGKCGVCGDAWDSKEPRAHEFGGTYGQGLIVRKYGVGSIINIRVELTASHMGYFEFALCPDYKHTSQECLDKNVLRLVRAQDGVDHLNSRYFPKDGNKVYEIKYRLPKKKCEHCVLQWRYIAGNNWGNCPNGTGAVGCGPQEEFRACADITIAGRGTEEAMVPDTPFYTTEPTLTTTLVPGTPEETYSPFNALIITLVSFLVVCLVLFLMYFHFYQIGGRIKKWVKDRIPQKWPYNNKDKGSQNVENDNVKYGIRGRTVLNLPPHPKVPPPLPPPRGKKSKIVNENGKLRIMEVKYEESLA